MWAPIRHPLDSPAFTGARAWTKRYTTQDWLALLQTQSDHRMLPASQRADLLVTRLYLGRRAK